MQIRNIFVAMALMAIGSHAAPLDARAVAKVNDAAVDQGYQGGYGAGSGGPSKREEADQGYQGAGYGAGSGGPSKREEADQGYQGIAPSKREDADQGYQGAGSGYPSKREEADQGYQGYGQG